MQYALFNEDPGIYIAIRLHGVMDLSLAAKRRNASLRLYAIQIFNAPSQSHVVLTQF